MTNLSDALISSRQVSAVVRTGVVTNWTPTYVQVNVGGSEVSAAFLDWYQPPIVGDLVAVIRQDASWLVLGRYAGAGENLVENPSFEDTAPAAGVPAPWYQFTLMTGAAPPSATVSVVADADSPQQGQVVALANTGLTAQDVLLTSSPISVNPGEQYFLSTYVAASGFVPGGSVTTPPHHAQLLAVFFADEVETFPSATMSDDYIMIERQLNVREAPPYSFLSGGMTVPSTVPAGSVMRVGLRAELQATSIYSIRFDSVMARRII